MSMTYKLSSDAAALLDAPLLPFDALKADPRLVPAQPGAYAWWFKTPPGDTPIEGTLPRDEFRLLYVGVAPEHRLDPARTSERTLRHRLRDHIHGAVARSTLRRSLAALLAPFVGLSVDRITNGKPRLSGDGEARLSAWMAANARVSWVTTREPWIIEQALLEQGPPLPLNIRGARHGFGDELRKRRALLVAPGAPGGTGLCAKEQS